MRTKGIYINISRRNDDLPEMIEEYSEKFNLSKRVLFFCAFFEGEGGEKKPPHPQKSFPPHFPPHRTRNLWHTTNRCELFILLIPYCYCVISVF